MSGQGEILVARYARERLKDGSHSEPKLLSDWRDTSAYVLLGDPGSGKTTALDMEAREVGGQVISATDFGVIPLPKPSKGITYFIDGLDERRADAGSESEALNSIRKQLVALKKPKFRITCREIDWRGTVDGGALKAVSPDGEIVELHLEPLSDADIKTILANPEYEIADPAASWEKLAQFGLDGWLRNPMALELILKAVLRAGSGQLSTSKLDIFQLACEQLASESNPHHRAARRRAPPPIDQILDDAGKLFAMLLLASEAGVSVSPDMGQSAKLSLESIPNELKFSDIQAALASKLFSTSAGHSAPRHRTIAEYLGAKAIGGLIENGLPIGRVLAMMSGQDGGIVEPLRGLHAWMAVTCPQARTQLIDRDPLGVVMYGDARAFSQNEKLHIFRALAKEANRYAWFRQGAWNAHPFGALGTRDMVGAMKEILRRPSREVAHQALLRCAFDAINFGDKLPDVLTDLAAIVEDNTFDVHSRSEALEAWLTQSKPEFAPARRWLDEIRNGTLDDANDEMRGALLTALYPIHIPPGEVFDYFSPVKRKSLVGGYRYFWSHCLIAQTPPGKFGELADALALMPLEREQLYLDFEVVGIFGEVISAALVESSVKERTSRIIEWLRIGRGNYDDVVLKDSNAASIAAWLTGNPGTLKRVYAELCLREAAMAPPERVLFWSAADLLYGAKYPRDWYNWLLSLASEVESSKLARFYFQRAAVVALEASVDFDIRMEDVEDWVKANERTWPKALEWLTEVWSTLLSPSPPWQQNQHKRNREYQTKRLAEQQLRATQFAEVFAKYKDGVINTGALHHLALAYKGRYLDIHGETPEARLQDLTGGTEAEVQAAVGYILSSLQRTDLPTVEAILASGLVSKEHFVRPACLIAADLAYAENPLVVATWSEALLKRLVAFWLTDGTQDEPDWYADAVRSKPQLVAEVMVPFAVQTIRKRPTSTVTGLWALARKDDLRDFARDIVPAVLEKFPVRANEKQLSRLVEELLPAALKHLEHKQLAAIASKRLANTSMDAGQRIAWLAMGTFQNNQPSAKALVTFLGKSQSRVQHLIHALVGHADRDMNHLALSIATQSLLIEILAPNVSTDRPIGESLVRPVDNARDLLRSMISTLARSNDLVAGRELARLRGLPALSAWFTSLDGAISDNTRSVRAASFIHASPQAVARTLANKAPANAADLQALVIDQLVDVGKEIRGSANNILDQFWTEILADVARKSQIENVCRDSLKQLLQNRLQHLNVLLDIESYAAGDKRMDLRAAISVDGKRRVVPIEIKKEDHKNVWTAWRDQLDKQYLNEPDSGGYGIYVVLWFGRAPKAFEGVKPKCAAEMATMLRNRIPAADRVRIAVLVMDLSLESEKPSAKKR